MRTPTKPTERPDLVWTDRVQRPQSDHRRQQSWAKDFGSTTLDRLQSK